MFWLCLNFLLCPVLMLEFTAVNAVVMEALRFKRRRNEGKKKVHWKWINLFGGTGIRDLGSHGN